MGDGVTQWSRRAPRPVQIDPTSPSLERPSSSLTTFDPKSLEIRELDEMNEGLIAFSDSLLAAPGRRPCIIFGAGQPVKNASVRAPARLKG